MSRTARVVTASNRAAAGVYEDKTGPVIVAWLRERGYDVPRHRELRFDVVGVRLDPGGRATEYEHLRGAF